MTETSIARRPPGEPDVENQYVRPFPAADLRLTPLPLLLPLVFRHATATERVEPRYLAREELWFG
jgi:hypothetical protein